MDWKAKVALGLGAGGMVLAALMADVAYENLRTDDPMLDRFPIRGRVLIYSFVAGIDGRYIMALINNESHGDPKNYLGDVSASGGPSIGPMQVYRVTAKSLGLWSPPAGVSAEDERALYAENAQNEDLGIRWGIEVFKSKLAVADNDIGKALALYNGNPALPQVQEYQAKALAFVQDNYQLIA